MIQDFLTNPAYQSVAAWLAVLLALLALAPQIAKFVRWLRKRWQDDMGTLQLLDVLEERMVGIAEQRRKRDDLEARQAEIENHPLFKTL